MAESCNSDALYNTGAITDWVSLEQNSLWTRCTEAFSRLGVGSGSGLYFPGITDEEAAVDPLGWSGFGGKATTYDNLARATTRPTREPSAPSDAPAIQGAVDPIALSTLTAAYVPSTQNAQPTFTAPNVTFSPPQRPGSFTGTRPTATDLESISIDDFDGYTLPSVPTTHTLTVPTVAELSIPSWTYTAPTASISPPVNTFSYDGTDYSVTSALTAKIEAWLDGGTGLPDAVWQMMIDRAMSSVRKQATQAIQQATNAWAARGWDRVGGALDRQIRQIRQSTQDFEQSEISKILREQASQEFENLQHAFSHGAALEGALVNAWHAERMRELEAASTMAELSARTIEAQVALVNAYLALYLAEAEVYAATIKAEVAELERYRVKVEAQEITTLSNEVATKLYREQVGAVTLAADQFEAEMAKVRVIADNNRNIARLYRQEVEAYAADISALSEEWRGHVKSLQNQVREAGSYATLANVHAERLRAWESGVNLEGAEIESKIARRRALFARIRGDLNRFESETRLKASEVRNKAQTIGQFWRGHRDYLLSWVDVTQLDETNRRIELSNSGVESSAKLATDIVASEQASAGHRLDASVGAEELQIVGNLIAAMRNVISLSQAMSETASFAKSKSCSWSFSDAS